MSAQAARLMPAFSAAGEHVRLPELGAPVDLRVGEQVEPDRRRGGERDRPGVQEIGEPVGPAPGRRCKQDARGSPGSSNGSTAPPSRGAPACQGRDAIGIRVRDRVPRVRLGGGASTRSATPPLARICGDVAERAHERAAVGFEHPRTRERLEVADLGLGQEAALGLDAPARVVRAELVGRPACRHDDGEPACHRLEDGHREALAAVGVHEDVAGAVQRAELVPGQLVLDVVHARQRARRPRVRAGRRASSCRGSSSDRRGP